MAWGVPRQNPGRSAGESGKNYAPEWQGHASQSSKQSGGPRAISRFKVFLRPHGAIKNTGATPISGDRKEKKASVCEATRHRQYQFQPKFMFFSFFCAFRTQDQYTHVGLEKLVKTTFCGRGLQREPAYQTDGAGKKSQKQKF